MDKIDVINKWTEMHSKEEEEKSRHTPAEHLMWSLFEQPFIFTE